MMAVDAAPIVAWWWSRARPPSRESRALLLRLHRWACAATTGSSGSR